MYTNISKENWADYTDNDQKSPVALWCGFA